jgi:hypothetical protein
MVNQDGYDPKIKTAERQAFCRACDGTIERGEQMMSWYSYRNRGMHIHLHLECVRRMAQDVQWSFLG